MAGCHVGDAAIRKLNLTGNNIGDKGSTVLAEMLKVCALCHPLNGCMFWRPRPSFVPGRLRTAVSDQFEQSWYRICM